jgi:hypothetical protein
MNAKTTTAPAYCPAHDPDHWVEAMIELCDGDYREDVDFPSWDAWVAAFKEAYQDGRVEPFAQHVYYLSDDGTVVGVSPGVERQYSPFFVKGGIRYSVW